VPDIIPAQRVTWMELFYDVIVAASMLLIYGSLAKHLSWQEFIWLSAIALVVFAMWLSTTLVFNQRPGDTTGRRLFVIAQMVALVLSVASMENSDRIDGDVGIVALGVAMLILAAMWELIRRSATEPLPADRLPVAAFLIGSVFLLSTALLPDSWNAAVFCIGAIIGFAPMFMIQIPRLQAEGRLDRHHLAERLGGLVLIMIGETFLEMAVLFTKGGDPRLFGVLIVLIVLTIVWWQYFTYVTDRPLGRTGGRLEVVLAGHALLILGLGSSAVALTEVGLALTDELPLPVLAGILGGSFALVYAGFATIVASAGQPRRQLVILILATIAFGTIGVLFSSVWELDEQAMSLIVVAISLATLLTTAATSRLPMRSPA
jgi:low temperature requirement protein LtrA